MASLPIDVAEASTCAPWGRARSRTFFFLFFVVKVPFEECQIQEEYMILFV